MAKELIKTLDKIREKYEEGELFEKEKTLAKEEYRQLRKMEIRNRGKAVGPQESQLMPDKI